MLTGRPALAESLFVTEFDGLKSRKKRLPSGGDMACSLTESPNFNTTTLFNNSMNREKVGEKHRPNSWQRFMIRLDSTHLNLSSHAVILRACSYVNNSIWTSTELIKNYHRLLLSRYSNHGIFETLFTILPMMRPVLLKQFSLFETASIRAKRVEHSVCANENPAVEKRDQALILTTGKTLR